jgi:hypothetical protein
MTVPLTVPLTVPFIHSDCTAQLVSESNSVDQMSLNLRRDSRRLVRC